MTIKRDPRKPSRFPITTYDFEWREVDAGHQTKALLITMCGAYDERGYRWYQSCEAFLRGEMVPGNAGRRYYAHFGGASDMIFLLREFVKLPRRYRTRGAFSGSSAIYVEVEDTEHADRKWQWIDSYWLIRASLRKIGEWLDDRKGQVDFQDVSMAELKDYNEQDCKLLYKAIQRVQDTVLSEGGELGITAASTALKTFLKAHMGKGPIYNKHRLNELARPAYTSSRVEVIRRECRSANYYDINSSFPCTVKDSLEADEE